MDVEKITISEEGTLSKHLPPEGVYILMRWENGVTMLGKYFPTLGYSTPASRGAHWVGKMGVQGWRLAI